MLTVNVITPLFLFLYEETWNISVVGDFVEFFIMPKRDTKTIRADYFHHWAGKYRAPCRQF